MKRLALTVFLLVTIYCLLVTAIYADIPRTLNYQGKLTNKQGYALDGSYNITFRLYDAATEGNLLWQEAHSGDKSVSVSKGLFSALLGTITPLNLPFDKQYYLSIQVGVDPEMTPRQTLASAPYAFTAESGVPKGTIMIWSTDTPPNGWLLCDGSAVSRTTYSALFNVIGTTYGAGNGTTTFNVPDLRGRIPLGQDDMGGNSANRVTAKPWVASQLGWPGDINVTYALGEHVSYSNVIYKCIVAHTASANFETDLAAGKWEVSTSAAATLGGTDGSEKKNGVTRYTNNFYASGNQPGSIPGHYHTHIITNFEVINPYLTLNYIIKS